MLSSTPILGVDKLNKITPSAAEIHRCCSCTVPHRIAFAYREETQKINLADDYAPKNEETCSFASWLLFSYMTPTLRLGWSKPLDLDDLPEMHRRNGPDHITRAWKKKWEKRLAGNVSNNSSMTQGLGMTHNLRFSFCRYGERGEGNVQILRVVASEVGPLWLWATVIELVAVFLQLVIEKIVMKL